MYSLVSLLSGIYPSPAMHSLLVTLYVTSLELRHPKGKVKFCVLLFCFFAFLLFAFLLFCCFAFCFLLSLSPRYFCVLKEIFRMFHKGVSLFSSITFLLTILTLVCPPSQSQEQFQEQCQQQETRGLCESNFQVKFQKKVITCLLNKQNV